MLPYGRNTMLSFESNAMFLLRSSRMLLFGSNAMLPFGSKTMLLFGSNTSLTQNFWSDWVEDDILGSINVIYGSKTHLRCDGTRSAPILSSRNLRIAYLSRA